MIRQFIKSDFEECKKYCDDHSINFPHKATLIMISRNESGEVDGIVGFIPEYRIEPLIASNPVTANTLARMMEGYAVGIGVQNIITHVHDEKTKFIAELEKAGFVIKDKSVTILEKEYHG